jgi:ribose transport system substrate-binding protein
MAEAALRTGWRRAARKLRALYLAQNSVGIGECVVDSLAKPLKGEKLDKVIDTGFYWYDKCNINAGEVAAVLYD